MNFAKRALTAAAAAVALTVTAVACTPPPAPAPNPDSPSPTAPSTTAAPVDPNAVKVAGWLTTCSDTDAHGTNLPGGQYRFVLQYWTNNGARFEETHVFDSGVSATGTVTQTLDGKALPDGYRVRYDITSGTCTVPPPI